MAAAVLVVVFSLEYIIHYWRTSGLTEQNVNTFMWSVIIASELAILALTTLFYRALNAGLGEHLLLFLKPPRSIARRKQIPYWGTVAAALVLALFAARFFFPANMPF